MPGAGKTTITGALRELLAQRGVATPPARDRRSVEASAMLRSLPVPMRRVAYLLHALRSTPLLLRISRCVWRLRPGTSARLAFALGLMVSLRFYRNAKQAPYDMVVLDQGAIQALISLAGPVDADRAEPCVELVTALRDFLPDAVVHLRVSPAVAARRLSARPGSASRVERIEAHARERVLQSTAALVEQMLARWREVTSGALLEVDGERSVAESADAIAGWLGQGIPR